MENLQGLIQEGKEQKERKEKKNLIINVKPAASLLEPAKVDNRRNKRDKLDKREMRKGAY